MLFLKECKKILFSLTFAIYVLVMLAMYVTQFEMGRAVEKPQPGSDDYGTTAKEVPEILMPAAVEGLRMEYESGSFVAYPVGFYKEVRLTERKKAEMEEILQELSQAELTYERFRELMAQADKIIGGGSKYSSDYLIGNFSRVPRTYEDALAEYEDFISKDKIMGGYARLFCDYMGIEASMFPVFLGVALCLKDRRSNMEKLVFQRNISSSKMILVRFAALVFMAAVPVFMMAIHGTMQTMEIYTGYDLDKLAFFKYTAMWILPNILFALAVGMFLTELTGTAIGILAMGLCWVLSVFASAGQLTGNITRFVLVVRHNSSMKAEAFFSHYDSFIFNRIFFTAAALLLILLTIVVFEKERGGHIRGFRGIFQSAVRKFKA